MSTTSAVPLSTPPFLDFPAFSRPPFPDNFLDPFHRFPRTWNRTVPMSSLPSMKMSPSSRTSITGSVPPCRRDGRPPTRRRTSGPACTGLAFWYPYMGSQERAGGVRTTDIFPEGLLGKGAVTSANGPRYTHQRRLHDASLSSFLLNYVPP